MNATDQIKKRAVYSDEFKRDTVREYATSGKSVHLFAKEIGIEQSILYRWVKIYSKTISRPDLPQQGKQELVDEIEAVKSEISAIRRSVDALRRIIEKSFYRRYQIDSTTEKLISGK
ncbi:MAG: transposase [Chitinispirillaceae bacterium]|nr:transposase [Chitinispirillaceae bacterium]